MYASIGNLKVSKGNKDFSEFKVEDSFGHETVIPFYIINGEKEGITICITAGVHGTEYPGIETVLRLYKDIDPRELKGTIIGCPMCNFEAFRKRSMFVNPIDIKNLNDTFPGNLDGSITEKIAGTLLKEFVSQADFHIDLHSGDSIEDLYPYVFYHKSGNLDVDNKSAWMANSYGLEYIATTELTGSGTSDKGNFYSSVSEMGIPSIQPEVGGLGLLKENMVKIHYQGVRNVLIGLNMITGQIDKVNKMNQVKLERFLRLRSQYDGIFYPNIRPGQRIKKDEVLAKITDYRSEKELAIFNAEEDGVVLWVIASPAVKQGDALMAIGIIEK